MIIDISHHQVPSKINYDKLAKQLKFAIIRTQYGSRIVDRHYKTHHRELKKRGVSTSLYAWVRGSSISDMRTEARDFYNRTKEFEPTVWFLDVEEQSMADMRTGISAYVDELRKLGAKKIGIYIAHHLYKQFNLNLGEVDVVWIPRYGKNNGKFNVKPDFPCDIHQYTSAGRLEGYNGNLDLNRLTGSKSLEFFTDEKKARQEKESKLDNIKVSLHGKEIEIEGIYKNNINYIPIRALEKLGYTIDWDKASKMVTIEYKGVK